MSLQPSQLGQLLYEAGWLPPGVQDVTHCSGDLLPLVQSAWESCELATLPAKARRRAARMQVWLAQQIASGAHLTLLSAECAGATNWLGERLIWWPQGRPRGLQVGIVSSRLGQRLDTQADWFTVFRAACSKINRDHDVLLTAADTTPDRFVRRAAELFAVRVISMICPRRAESIAAWFKRIRRIETICDKTIHPAYLSPELSPRQNHSSNSDPFADQPVRDRAVVSSADRLLVFHLRRGGHLETLVRGRLNDPAWPAASVFVALGKDLVKRKLADELLERGAIGWVVLETLRHDQESLRVTTPLRKVPIIELPVSEDWPWLTHCTRSQPDGWPDQNHLDYFDELLLTPGTADRSAYAAIRRIVATQRLVATSRMIRGDVKVVCFTAVPLVELPQLRSFRSHLARWDFEPYGICIRRDWLEHRRCTPVRYGDDALWESLSSEDRAFFQVRTSRSRRSGRVTDWSIEQEWRQLGDVDLSELPSDAAIVFVPSLEEAQQMAMVSRWPITVLSPRG